MRAHNQHSETRRPSDRDRIVTTGPSRFQPARPEVFAEMMSLSVAGIPENRCRTTIAERMVETRAELPFIGDPVGLFRAQPGRPKRRMKPREAGGERVLGRTVPAIGPGVRQSGADAPLISSVTLNAATGLLRPFSSRFPRFSSLATASTASAMRLLTRICPSLASAQSRAARLHTVPIAV